MPLSLPTAPTLSASPVEGLLQLKKAGREKVATTILPADLRWDRAHADEEAARAAFDEARQDTRVLGPASGGVAVGPGGVALLSALGPTVASVRGALGDDLGLAVDLGLAWDISTSEVLEALRSSPEWGRIRLLLVALPEPAAPGDEASMLWLDAAPALREYAGELPIVALGRGPLRDCLENRDIATVSSLDALIAAARLPKSSSTQGRIAIISALTPLSTWFDGALRAAGLELAAPKSDTLAHLETELPRHARLGGHIRIPTPTERHLEVARSALEADSEVDLVWVARPVPEPHVQAEAIAARLRAERALATGPSPISSSSADAEDLGSALLYARRLMKRDVIERSEALGILAAVAPRPLSQAPSIAVASLAMARHAASRLGYPVLLGPGSRSPLADETSLTEAWESLVAGLGPASPGHQRHEADPWSSRHIVPIRGPLVHLRWSSFPLPTLIIEGPTPATLPSPLRERELAQLGPLGPLAEALEAIAHRLPELQAMTALATEDGTALDATLTLAQTARPSV